MEGGIIGVAGDYRGDRMDCVGLLLNSIVNEKLKAMFPRASKSFYEANSGVGLQNPVAQPNTTDALDSKKERKRTSHERVTVCVTSFRTRLLDLDNCTGGQKFLCDCLKETGLIRDDNPESIELTVRQEKVQHRHQEKTVIELRA